MVALEMNREDRRVALAQMLASKDGITLPEIKSTVIPEQDASNWRKYLAKADDELADPFIDPFGYGMFREHSCSRCNNGLRACPNGQAGPHRNCEHPHARND